MIRNILITLLLNLFVVTNLFTQEMPLVYDVENTGADYPKPYLPSFNELPTITNLPDPFEWSDGRGHIANFSDWKYRRSEIKAEIENYEIGEKPDRPDTIEASYSNGTLTVIVTVNGKTLTLNSSVILPDGDGPFPAIIGMNSPSGSIPADILTSRNIARITYSHNQVTSYNSPNNTDPYYQLYPHLNLDNTGQYSAWAWGVSRLIDGLELVQDILPIDVKHLAVSGCSYAGKMAIFAGAFDERIALTFGIESGGGGYTTWRYSEEINKTESVETLGKTNYSWFRNSMAQFSNAVSKLPHDHHELMAMVAPRALFVTGNPGWVWLADESGHVGSNAAKEVWNALGVPDRFGYSLIGGHNHCAIPNEQIPEIEAFLDKFLLGVDTENTNVATTPYNTNLIPWITWSTPTLSNGESYFEITSLVSPPNLEKDLETNITLIWNQVEGAIKYNVQLSAEPAFNNTVISDSTTDTTKAVIGLLKGKKYYWRIQIKNSEGSLGPWSEQWNFSTFVELPSAPHLISATPSQPNRADYITYKWNKIDYSDHYLIQISRNQIFNTFAVPSTTTQDTIITLSGFAEGIKYYWRIQANNISGSGPWSDISNFTTLLSPTDLELINNTSNEITLTWKDNSTVEDGYVIERMQSPQTSFTVIDTVKGSAEEEYIDINVEQSQTYTYRIKAYKDSATSSYSNEASLVLVGVNGEKEIPTEYSIRQNYPNPFNPNTKIKFALPQTALTKIIIYDLLGREIQTLINKELKAGNHEINFDATNFQSGVYFYRIQSGNFVSTKKMILMK